jgi:signal transduction histidine kinase
MPSTSDDRKQATLEFMSASSEHKPFAIDYRLRRSDGEYRWVIDSARPRFSESAEFLGYIGSVIDITERKQYEVALKDADRRKDEFLATLAHELRNPLAPILNAVDILKTKGPGAKDLQWSQDIICKTGKTHGASPGRFDGCFPHHAGQAGTSSGASRPWRPLFKTL